ncbi:alpha/beta fold hydrolase [Streptomyces sp. NP160]|uniref:alpha/beta fold hydrolase n=1 Tax=Streptomyces sp. NP160 TaxID=2586637 RepID=UPI00111A0371|nr:alpha/beta fold hydrolase [Streptomyces sp. NP160]TNM69667.1 alpha/beta fold hydrolase [Streptomyces sp. NP160]
MSVTPDAPVGLEHLDVVVIGAGISGIGAGRYLTAELPGTSFAVLEARGASGGTWDLFRYPGVRSDSDLSTFGYEFKPWLDEQAIADAPRILRYLREAASEAGLDEKIRYHQRVVELAWSSETARWTVTVERTDEERSGERFQLTAGWVFAGTGYYRYEAGYTPELPGLDRFAATPGNTVVHPQHWPQDLDLTGRRVVVVGSGATAVTVVPAIAEQVAHVTMLQRTPTYVMPVSRGDALGARLRRWFGDERGAALTRRKNIAKQRAVWRFSQEHPRAARAVYRRVVTKALPEGYDIGTHFDPPYDPWDQRVCASPSGDLFAAIRSGRASVVTDRIATFDATGVRLVSGERLEADVIVTATGLAVQIFGGTRITVDGEVVVLPERLAYKGMMLSGVPNLAFAIGYTNSSWTLKVGLLCEHFVRLLRHMREHGYDTARPVPSDPDMPTRPYLDFAAGYIQRAVGELPRQGSRPPWTTSMDFHSDVALLREGSVVDPELELTAVGRPSQDRFVQLPAGPRICFRDTGGPGEVVLLVAGLGQDLTAWPAALVDGLVARGLRVVRFDNRDIGRSSRIDAPSPGPVRQLLRRPRPDAYDLADMAADAVGLLDHLGVQRAHVVGQSLGGMVAQVLASRRPDRVASLTSIYSTTGAADVGGPARSTLWRLRHAPATTVEVAVQRHVAMMRHLAGPGFPFDDDDAAAEEARARGAWERGGGPASRIGPARQIQAIAASGDRTAELARVSAPTLVINGDRDVMVDPSGGAATAAAIAGARHVVVPGMGHLLSPGLLDRLVGLIGDHVAAAAATPTPPAPTPPAPTRPAPTQDQFEGAQQ